MLRNVPPAASGARLLAVSRRKLERSPDCTPDGLARDAVGQRLNNGALAECSEAVLRRPHPEVTRAEVQLQPLPGSVSFIAAIVPG